MKIQLAKLVSAIFLASTLLTVISCGGGDGDDAEEQTAFSELEFGAPGASRLNASHLAVVYLEPSDATATDHGDTELGVDRVPYTFQETTTLTYSLGSELASQKIESMVMRNSNGVELFRIDASNRSATVTMEAGDYELVITAHQNYRSASSGGADHSVIFIRPVAASDDGSALAKDAPTQAFTVGTTDADCPDCILDGCDLTGADMSDGSFQDASFQNTILTNANLDGANLTAATFANATMTGASLVSANCNQGIFAGATVENTNFQGARLTSADFTGDALVNTNFSGAQANSCIMEKVRSSGANFSNADLSSCNFRGGGLGQADFSNSELVEVFMAEFSCLTCKFDGADMTGGQASIYLPGRDKLLAFQDSTFVGTTWIDGSTCYSTVPGFCSTE